MKRVIVVSILLLTMHFQCKGIAGRIRTTDTSVSGREKTTEIAYFSASASYVSGGLTFVYPVGLFSSTPVVRISIELSGLGFLASRTISAQITANSSASTTIRVTLGTIVSILEAATGDVIVHIFSTEF